MHPPVTKFLCKHISDPDYLFVVEFPCVSGNLRGFVRVRTGEIEGHENYEPPICEHHSDIYVGQCVNIPLPRTDL